jgi:hypothetical protein
MRRESGPLMYTHKFYFRNNGYAPDDVTKNIKSEGQWTFDVASPNRLTQRLSRATANVAEGSAARLPGPAHAPSGRPVARTRQRSDSGLRQGDSSEALIALHNDRARAGGRSGIVAPHELDVARVVCSIPRVSPRCRTVVVSRGYAHPQKPSSEQPTSGAAEKSARQHERFLRRARV